MGAQKVKGTVKEEVEKRSLKGHSEAQKAQHLQRR
jgi:hypothetical protein